MLEKENSLVVSSLVVLVSAVLASVAANADALNATKALNEIVVIKFFMFLPKNSCWLSYKVLKIRKPQIAS